MWFTFYFKVGVHGFEALGLGCSLLRDFCLSFDGFVGGSFIFDAFCFSRFSATLADSLNYH